MAKSRLWGKHLMLRHIALFALVTVTITSVVHAQDAACARMLVNQTKQFQQRDIEECAKASRDICEGVREHLKTSVNMTCVGPPPVPALTGVAKLASQGCL